MIFEALAIGSLLLLVNGGYSPRSAARIVGRFAGSSAASLRRIRAEAESQLARQSERAETILSKGEGVENQRRRMERLRAVQAEASSLIQLLGTPPATFSRPTFVTSPSTSTTTTLSSDTHNVSSQATSISIKTPATSEIVFPSEQHVNSMITSSFSTSPKESSSSSSTASRISALLELERQHLH
jgi:hypothetical protein